MAIWEQTVKTLALAAVLAAFAGCTNGLNQDPYANQPDEVRKAGPMDPKPKEKPHDALSSEYLRINADPESLEFVEGAQGKAKIIGAVLGDVNGHDPVLGQDYELAIDNIGEFPGASFDASTGEFKWSPQPGFVDANYTRNIHLTVTLTTKTSPILRTQKTILGVITRSSQQPTIVSIDDLTSNPVKEGDTRDFKVVVRDPHADAKSADGKPRLSIVADQAGKASASNLIYCLGGKGCSDPTQDPSDPSLYTFKMRVDLQNKEVTKNKSSLSFGVMATSRFGEASAVREGTVAIVTTLQDPTISWSSGDAVNVVAGRENVVNFVISDMTSDSNLTINFDTRCDLVLGTTATCGCTALSRDPGTQLCTITWAVPAQPMQTDYDVMFTTFSQTRDQSQIKQTQQTRTLHVIQPPTGGGGGGGSGPIHTNNRVSSNGGAK